MIKIMLIGEAYGEAEEKSGLPFQGLAGRLLDGVLEEVGILRQNCVITNVVNQRPANNNFGIYYEKSGSRNVPTPFLLTCYERLRNEIVANAPNVIVCLGNEALKAVTDKSGILNWRGSILQTPLGKVIPTVHPEEVLSNWTLRIAMVTDLKKVLEQAEFPEMRTTTRNLLINPTFKEVESYVNKAKEAQYLSFDIETETEQITCIGLAISDKESICIPFWWGASGSYWSQEQETQIWEMLRPLLESTKPLKIGHNLSYDIEYLRGNYGIQVNHYFDTMLGFHTLYSELDKSLAYIISLYTNHPFYKFQLKTNSMNEFWSYNATDALLTYECGIKILEELTEHKLEWFYFTMVHPLINPLLAMTIKGVRFDTKRCNVLRKQYRYDISVLQHKLEQVIGYPLNINSPKKVTNWLYEELKIAKRYNICKDTGEKTLTADEDALKSIYKETGNEAVKIILEMREKNKVLSNYFDINLDRDNRIRCAYKITGTETGRLSSGATIRKTGTNLQNIPNGVVKNLFLADEGKTLINADLSQAEARVVAYLAGENRLIKVFEEGGDIHKRNAANIFRIKESEVTDDQRQLAKRVVHASNYGMGPRTFASTAGISESEAKRLLNLYFATYPRIRLWQMQVQNVLKSRRTLTNPLGRKRIFFNRWNESLVKEGLAFLPQSTVADIVNQALVCMHGKFALNEHKSNKAEILLQVHDSIVVQCLDNMVEDTISIIRNCMAVPVEINGKFLSIPVDFKVGKCWGELHKA